MKQYNWDFLEQLCAIHAVSGREDAMTAFMRDTSVPLWTKSVWIILGMSWASSRVRSTRTIA